MSALDFLPWQRDPARRWLAARDRFAHAWLIHGLPGIGQQEFALAGAASLLCESPRQGLACGECQACRWVLAGNHPDLRRIRPDAQALQEGGAASDADAGGKKQPSREIRIEQIRSLLPWFNMATHRGGWRVAVLYPAEALNVIAANALLKILEEPPGHTVFLLVAQAPDRLLPTLVSRCRRLPLSAPPQAEALPWLQQHGVTEALAQLAAAGGAPLLALRRAQQQQAAVPDWLRLFLEAAARGDAPGDLADALLALDASDWLDGFQRLWLDLSLAAHGAPARYYPELESQVRTLARAAAPTALAQAGQWLQAQRRLAQHPLNAKLRADHAAQTLLRAVRPAQSTPSSSR
ncbi:DNA polymerase III subunit delta' [Castellaniella caeni]|uniref:DNA polymerase III subunit delta' n=1 Tax=Castellaniella caeni TaxID=266123 RepID=UPI0008361499|nr:DNA polymerase III subunit delta' [Castellaniella caeni]